MSVQAILPVVKFIGTALAVKSTVEGLKEGNLLKAALGGFGAYMGLSGLGTVASNSADVATVVDNTAAAGLDSVAGGVADLSGGMDAIGNAAQVSSNAATGAATMNLGTMAGADVVNTLGDTLGMSDVAGLTESGVIGQAPSFGEAVTASADLGGSGLMSSAIEGGSILDQVKQPFSSMLDGYESLSPETRTGLLNVGGQVLGGIGKSMMLEDQRDWEQKILDDRRKRKGYTASMTFMRNRQFNPATGTWS